LIDDSFQLHEKLGETLVSILNIQTAFGLRSQDFGELAVSFFFGTLLFSFIVTAYLRSNSLWKKISKHIVDTVISFFRHSTGHGSHYDTLRQINMESGRRLG